MTDHTCSHPSATAKINAHLPRIRNILCEAFDTEFQFWVHENSWVRLETVTDSPACELPNPISPSSLLSLVNNCNAAGRPIVVATPDDRYAVVLPIGSSLGFTAAAVGTVAGTNADSTHRLAAMAMRAIEPVFLAEEHQRQLDAYAEQLSGTYEELAWLRELAAHIEYCDAASHITTVATRLLPSLCDVLGAESVALLHEPDAAEEASHEGDSILKLVSAAGRVSFPEDIYCRIVRQFRAKSTAQPAVYNDLAHHAAFADVEYARACILVRVGREDRHFGWLLALNKVWPDRHRGEGLGPKPYRRSECEFGTIEAGLMDAASVMLAAHARNIKLFRETESLFLGLIHAMVDALDARDTYTRGHSDRVARIAMRLAQELGLSHRECEDIHLAGLLHDVGKIGIRDNVLLKPDRLTDEEFAQIKTHPAIGHSILKHVSQLTSVLPGVLHHHESFDGKGYPDGLRSEQIPLPARIVAVADAYDAMTSDRPYRKAMPFEKAEATLRENSNKQWDGGVLEAFFALLEDVHAICSRSDGCGQGLTDSVQERKATSMTVGSEFVAGSALPVPVASPQ